ncbi:MAG: alpha-ketoglutarate-dependent dioxygenase AlkB family protein [Thermaurantimonas sp.]
MIPRRPELFDKTVFDLVPGMLLLHTGYLTGDESARLYQVLKNEIHWQQHYLTIYGRKIPFPRLMCWMGQAGAAYRFSGNEFTPAEWHADVLTLKDCLSAFLQADFNSVLLNLYRNGSDSMSWHADDEPELGRQPIIASVSLGAERTFVWKRKSGGASRRVTLPDGSLLVMSGDFQHQFLHALPKTSADTPARINLTFRAIRL